MIEYKTLFEISNLLNSEMETDTLVKLAIDKVIETTHAQRGLLLIRDSSGDFLYECSRHCDKGDIEKPDSETSKTIIRKVLKSGDSLVLENALQDTEMDVSASMRSLNLMSIACAPLKAGVETFGVIYIDNRDITALFNENTRTLLDELCKLISVPVRNSLERRSLVERERKLRHELQEQKGYVKIIGDSPNMAELLKMVDRVAATDATVLITGETGTGKELIARELHFKSPRQNHELVTLNCSAIPENLLEAELFGHEKGAFTGADKSKPGWFETADKGTIFLDEVGEMSLAAQVRLLRLIQFGEYTPVGSKETRKVDVRILAATNRDIEEMVKQGSFRRDLYYRLNVIELKLPPLRERDDDILRIAESFIIRFAKDAHKTVVGFSEEAKHLLLNYAFPGNVRELENIVQRAVILCQKEIIAAHDLPIVRPQTTTQSLLPQEETHFGAAKEKLIADFERTFLMERLRETNGNISQAARNAAMYKKNFIDKMKQYGIKGEAFKK